MATCGKSPSVFVEFSTHTHRVTERIVDNTIVDRRGGYHLLFSPNFPSDMQETPNGAFSFGRAGRRVVC